MLKVESHEQPQLFARKAEVAVVGWAILSIAYYLGWFVAAFVFPARVNGGRFVSPLIYLSAWMHPPSRRNGLPWVIKTFVKVSFWPVVFAYWMYKGRPPSPVLFGDAAAERLGLPETSYATQNFATKWKAKS